MKYIFFSFFSVILNWNAILKESGASDGYSAFDSIKKIPSAMLQLAVSLWKAGLVHQVKGELYTYRILSGLPTTCMIM